LPIAAPETAVPPYANDLNQAGHRGRVLRVWQTAALRRSGKKVQFMQFGADNLRPVVCLHSLEYPAAPPWGLCVDAAAEGFGVIAVRRGGFGESSAVDSTDEEAAVISEFLDEAGLDDVILVVEGTARQAGLKLAQESPRVSFTFLVRPAYADAISGDLDPWTVNLVIQALQTQAGASLSLAALTLIGRRGGHQALYEMLFPHADDRLFIQTHTRDLQEAWESFSRVNADTFRRNLSILINDPTLGPGALADFPGMALIGADTLPEWREAFEAKSASLGIPTACLPRGAFFTLHQSAGAFIELLKTVP
jgi:hypothetical protein